MRDNKTLAHHLLAHVVAGALLVGGGVSSAAPKPAGEAPVVLPVPGKGFSHCETQLVRELTLYNLTPWIKAGRAAAGSAPVEKLYDAAELFLGWDALPATRQARETAAQRYLDDLQAYLDSKPPFVDGSWAMDQAKFLIAKVSDAIVSRIEYSGSTQRDRAFFAPLASMTVRLLGLADQSLQVTMAQLEKSPAFNEKAFMALYTVKDSEVPYNQCFGWYFSALAAGPQDPQRLAALKQAAGLLAQWADGDADSGVKFQSLLLRGKIQSEAGQFKEAQSDLQAAAAVSDPNLAWVAYQARFQGIVSSMREGLFDRAQKELAEFRTWISADAARGGQGALIGLDMLSYRIEAQRALASKDPAAAKTARSGALAILEKIRQREVKFQAVVLDHLANELTDRLGALDKVDYSTLAPLEVLALANRQLQILNPDETKDVAPEERAAMNVGIAAASHLLERADAAAADKLEAAMVAGLCSGRLGRLVESVKFKLVFIKASPKDPRAQELLDAALMQIGQLKKAGQNEEVDRIAQEALGIATNTFGQKKWAGAMAMEKFRAGKLEEARADFEKVPDSDPTYLEARFNLILIQEELISRQLQSGAAPAAMQGKARELMGYCDKYLELLENPPKTLAAELVEKARLKRSSIWLMVVAKAIDPLQDAKRAIGSLEKLKTVEGTLPPAIKGQILRYRIKALQMDGQSAKAQEVVRQYLVQSPKEAIDTIKGMIFTISEEYDKLATLQPEKAQAMAGDAVGLLGFLVDWAKSDTAKQSEHYVYRQLLADMRNRAGQAKEATELYLQLQQERPQDLANFLGEARSSMAAKDFETARKLYVGIVPRLQPGSESFWECYLRIIQSNEALHAGQDVISSSLKDLRAIYGSQTGGKTHKAAFQTLLQKYNVS